MSYILTIKEKLFKRDHKSGHEKKLRKIHLIKHGHDGGNSNHVGMEDVVAQSNRWSQYHLHKT